MNKTHVVIDGCCLGRRKTGNETYLRGLLTGLQELNHPDYRFTVLTTSANQTHRNPFFNWVEIPLGNFLTRNFLIIPQALKKLKPDLYHGVYWSRFFAQPVPTVLMVHDLSFVSFPQGFYFHERLVYANLVRLCTLAARHILTVSEFSKQEIIKHWGIEPSKITVTYDGLDDCFKPPENTDMEISETPYILYVGNLHPRKNLVRLLKAFILLKENLKIPHRLKIVGQAAWMADEVFREIRESGFSAEVDFTGYVSQGDLIKYYQKASVCAYVSLYEGFGLPLIEAMACGCPVVCSNATSIPEICGDAAILVDPESVTSIADGIKKVLTNSELAQNLRNKGYLRAKSFTWKGCAQNTLNAYSTVLRK